MHLENDCGVWIQMLSHKMKKHLDAELADIGITGVQSRVLHYIIKHCPEGPVFQKNVETAFGLSRSTATGILQLMEKNGIIRRESVEYDARLKSLVPTEKAVRMDAGVGDCLQRSTAVMQRGLSPGQIQLFLEIVRHMANNFDEWAENEGCAGGCELSL